MLSEGEAPIKAALTPKVKELGGFTVRRALPYLSYRSVGPWVFFDHFGPVDFAPGDGMNVRPHPHIGLATVTYLFEGEIWHRDSLGNSAPIHPGAVNLMVAGSGIVHSERTRDELRASGYRLHGLQLWHALPEDEEQREASFHHHPAETIPETELENGATIRVMMGEAFGLASPVETFSQTLYYEIDLPDGAAVTLPDTPESALYVVDGEAEVDGAVSERFQFSILSPGARRVTAKGRTRFAVIGGAPLGKRHIKWNFVSSSRDRIAQAATAWRNGEFPTVPGDATESIPLPKELIF
ncbi:pirin family protein [uncultured Algimonas sp.]|uniref:pirin family protein n=1 Tax=uncultured Algimonas sp. TaxID=1547920 RepID=UPI00261B22B5|nr:pirin family protein [uncultured Algimonas sp.]